MGRSLLANGFAGNMQRVTPISLGFTDMNDMRFISLIIAMGLYAIGGSPTPDSFGAVELLIGAFLVMAVSPFTALNSFRNADSRFAWHGAARLLCLYGLTLPIFWGIVNGNYLQNIIRDIVPFIFLLLPLLLRELIGSKDIYLKIYTLMVIFIGLSFTLRVFIPHFSASSFGAELMNRPDDPLYLGNAPTVLFAGMMLLGGAGLTIYKRLTMTSMMRACLLAGLSVLPLMTMALIVQRASLGLVILSMAVLIVYAFMRRPVRALPLLIFAGIVALISFPIWQEVVSVMMRKTSLVGFNMRWQEMAAVFEVLQTSWVHLVFGKGWGTTFASPAVGGVVVNFTHSLMTLYWLKTGIIGVVFVFSYLFLLARQIQGILYAAPVLALALLSILVIDVFLYASFKSFDFGAVLLLIPLWANKAAELRQKPDSV